VASPPICADYYARWTNLTISAKINPFNVYSNCDTVPNMPHLSEEVVKGSKMKADFFGKVGSELLCIYYPELTTYLTDSQTLTDLHISSDASTWTMCSSESYSYDATTMNSSAEWQALMAAGSYKLLMYSGNKDMTVPTLGTQRWLNSLNMTAVSTCDFNKWTLTKQPDNLPMVGGFYTDYSQMQYSTVHGAGMFTGYDHPQSTYYLISNWMAGTTTTFCGAEPTPPEPERDFIQF
jgi:hypothetical protein